MKGEKGDTVYTNGIPYKWLDGVYGRDHITAGGTKDGTVFTGTKDKNGDNPETWNVGIGDTPQKNDIVDAMGYLRQDVNVDADGHKHLWAFGAASTRSADGTSHIDFEFFREDVEYINGMYTTTGSDAGHTGWRFDEFGEPIAGGRGDIIVSVDLESGGEHPAYSIRVWMMENIVLNGIGGTPFNNLPNIPFELTGVYNKGLDAGVWCYAEIRPRSDFDGDYDYMYASVDSLDVPAAPWGTLEGPQADTAGEFIPYQFTEIGINMTAFGLDALEANSDPCKQVLGTLFVKTRSSGEFTAELKDFAGPYRFGFSTQVELIAEDIRTCVSPDATNVVDLTQTVVSFITDESKADDYKFYESESDALSGTNPLPPDTLTHYEFTGDSVVVWVSAESLDAEGCFGADSFVVRLYDNPVCNVTTTDETYSGAANGTAKVTVTGENGPFTYNWVASQGGTIGGGQGTDSIYGLSDGRYDVYITDAAGCETDCYGIVDFIASPPTCSVETVGNECFGDSSGYAVAIVTPAEGGPFLPYTYYWYEGTGLTATFIDSTVTNELTDTLFNLKAGVYTVQIKNGIDPNTTECGGEVTEPDFNPVAVVCSDITLESCLDESTISTHLSNWLDTAFTVDPGTEPMDTIYKVDDVVYDLASIKAMPLDECGDTLTVRMIVTDYCGLADSCDAKITIPADMTAPVLDDPTPWDATECNVAWPTTVSVGWTDVCGAMDGQTSGTVDGVMVDEGWVDDCTQYRDYTFDLTDDCGNAADQKTLRITRHYDMTAPVLDDPTPWDATECNVAWPTTVSVGWTDVCGAMDGQTSGTVDGVMVDEGWVDACTQYRDYTFDLTDDCGNAADQKTLRITRHYDMTAPVLDDPT
ncbi:SprB repeat-containing protein, partial [Draconibacterium sp.]|uniref:SprB repeat-containing protein n=1 Tax=Draconibacterium sp. TaxID=1965318 RepID=UPI00356A09BA